MKHVLDAISALSIKIDTISDQHRSLEQLACEDSKVKRSVQEIRTANNINELNNATQLLEWYYHEITECAIMRCLPCFELLVVSRPTLRPLTPFRAQQLLNPTGSSTLPSGISVNKEKSRLLISGLITKRGIVRRIIVLITFVSLDVDRQSMKKQWRNIERRRSSKRELLQRAGTSLEQQSLMLSLGQPENTLRLLFLCWRAVQLM